MYGNMFDGFKELFLILAIFFPLGVWKVFDILFWLYKHISISFGTN